MMGLEPVKGTPFDYSNDKKTVYFEVASKKSTIEAFHALPFVDTMQELEYGFEVNIAIQQIPEIIRYLSSKNIAIYAVIPRT